MRITSRTKKKVAALLALLLLSGAAAGGLMVVRKVRLAAALEVALKEGTTAYQTGDYATAMRRLSFYVGRRKEPDAIFMLADSRRHVPDENRKHLPAAITYARLAAELDPESLRAHELLLDLYLQMGYATEASSTADSILAIDPKHRSALETRAFSLARVGKNDEALRAALQLVEANPDDVIARRQVAEMMSRSGSSAPEIREYLEKDEQLAEQSFPFALLRAEAAMITGDTAESLERAKHAATLPIATARDLSQFLRLLDTLAPVQPEAPPIIDSVLGREYPDEVRREVAIIVAERAWRAGRNDLALQSIEAALAAAASITEAPDAALGWFILLRQEESSPELKAIVAERVAELRRRNTSESLYWLDLMQGASALTDGDIRAAGEHLESASSRQPTSTLAEFLLGQLDQRKGEYRRAQTRWDALLRQHPNWRMLRAATVELLLESGEHAQAAQRAQAALAWTRQRPEALQLCRAIMLCIESRQADPALTAELLTTLTEIARQATEDPAIQTCAARAYLAANQPQEADRAVQRLLAIEEGHSATLLTPLALAYRAHDPAAATQLLELAQTNITPASVYARAISMAQQDRPGDARQLIEQRIAATEGRERLGYQLAMARLLTFINDPGAAGYLSTLATEHAGNPEVQTALLESDASWQTEEAVSAAIQRLKTIIGEGGSAWRLHEARRLLTFAPSHARAAEAIQVLGPLIRQESPPPMAFAMVGEAYMLLDDRTRAIEQFGRAVDADASDPAFYPRLIDLLQAAGRSDEAVRRLTAFALINPLPSDFLRRRAQAALLLAVWDQARNDFVALANPGSPEDRFGLAISYLRLGQNERAGIILDELATLPQATPAMLVTAADHRATRGDVAGGRQLLESAPADLPDVLRQALVAAYLQRNGDITNAEAVLVAAAAETEGTINPDAIAELARFYLEAGRLDEAKQQLDRGLGQDPDHAVLRRVQALIRIQGGDDTPEAWAQLSDTLANWADAPAGLRELTAAMQQRSANPTDTAGHIARLRKITADHPSFYNGWQILAQSLAETGDLGAAADAASAAARNNPSDPRPTQLAMTFLIQQQRYSDALVAANQWRTRTPRAVIEPDLAVAWLMQQLERSQEGLRIVEPHRRAVLASDDPERITLYAGLLLDVGRVDEAGAILQPLAEQSRQWALTWVSLASRIKANEPARQWLTRIAPILASASTAGATTEPGQDEATLRAAAHLALGEAWFQITSRTKAPADAEKALSALAEAAQSPAFRFSAHAISAAACEAIGNREEAERHYRLALAERDDDPITLNNFAYFLAQEKAKAPEAADFAGRAVTLAREAKAAPPVLRAILDTHGVALLECERWSEAETVFNEALAIAPNAPDLLIGLAEARFGKGDTAGAAETLERARIRIASEPLVATRAARMAALEAKLGR